MSESTPREWQFYVTDMLGFARKVLAYTHGIDRDGFVGSGLIFDAALRNIELIGEAATHIPEEVRNSHADVPWRQLIATRNRLIHGYLGIDNDILWSIVEVDMPLLIEQLQRIDLRAP